MQNTEYRFKNKRLEDLTWIRRLQIRRLEDKGLLKQSYNLTILQSCNPISHLSILPSNYLIKRRLK
jgi:hypothetical protein